MSYLDMVEKFSITQREESKSKVWTPSIEEIPFMKLKEFAKRNIAIPIRSEYLDCEVWLCSNTGMQKQIKNDDPEAITYTVDELKHLIKLNPNPDELRKIHNTKEIFNKSTIINSVLRNES